MASILFCSLKGDGVPLGLRLMQDGHIVKFYFKKDEAKKCFKGMRNPSQVGDPRKMLEQYDLVLFDMAEMGELADELVEKGKIVLGGGTFNDKLELDRDYGYKVAQSLLKISVPNAIVCNSKRELLDYVDESSKPLCVKPFDNKSTGLTFVSQDKENRTLKSLLYKNSDDYLPCLVQDYIEGIEISTEGWFNGKQFITPYNHTIEYKRFMNNDLGPNVGCMGTVVWCCDKDKLVEKALMPLEPLLKKVNYVGPIDVNCIVNENGAYFLEFTPRFGYDAVQAFMELIRTNMFDFLYSIGTNQKTEFQHSNNYSISIRLSLSPYPHDDDFDDLYGVQALEVEKDALKHVWLADIMKDKSLNLVAGVDGVLGCVTARGESIRECQRRAYRTIKNIALHPDLQYRTDIGNNVESKIGRLKELGWL